MEPPEVPRFLRQELLIKVGHSWWNRPRVFRYDKDDEREPTQPLRSVVVVPPGQEQPEGSLDQQELGPAVSGDRMTLIGPVTSLPHTPGGDIVVAGTTEESPRTREGRLAAATLEQEMGRRSVAEAIQPIRERAVAMHRRLKEPSRGKWWPRPATPSSRRGTQPPPPPVWPESSGSPTESQPAGTGETGVLAEPPPPQRKLASTPRPQRDGSLRGTERKRQSSIKRRLEGRNHHRLNSSWPSLTDWTFRPSRRSVTCLRGPVPRFTSRGRQSGWSEPPPSGDGGRPRPWRSSWEDEG